MEHGTRNTEHGTRNTEHDFDYFRSPDHESIES